MYLPQKFIHLSSSQVHPPVFPQGVASWIQLSKTTLNTQADPHPSVKPCCKEPSSATDNIRDIEANQIFIANVANEEYDPSTRWSVDKLVISREQYGERVQRSTERYLVCEQLSMSLEGISNRRNDCDSADNIGMSTSPALSGDIILHRMTSYMTNNFLQSPRGIFINQAKYALETLKKYGMDLSDPVDTPMVDRLKLDEDLMGIPDNAMSLTAYQMRSCDVKIREEVRREVLSFLEIDWLAGHQRSKEARPSQQQRQNTLQCLDAVLKSFG
ncbi:hypothetical protein Tco_0227281 [Tanacetum coccineum]